MSLLDLLKLPSLQNAISCQRCHVYISNDSPPQYWTTPPGYSGPIDRTRWTHTTIFPIEYAN